VTTAATTPAGTYTLTVTGTSGTLTHTATVTLVVNAPDFSVGASPSSQTVSQGGSTTYNLTITPTNGFSGQVTLSVSGLPSAATGSFTINPATSTSALSVQTDSATPAGSYTLTITGTSATLTHTATVTLVVTATDFTLSATPASQTVTQGSSTSYNVTITPTNGFNGQVTLSVSGLPTAATGSFTTNPTTSTSTLSVQTSATTPAGSYTVTITGVSGSRTHTSTVTLVVAAPDFTVSATPASQTVVRGNSTSYNITINPTNGFTGQVTLSVTGLPAGASGSFTTNPATSTSTLSISTSATTPVGTSTLTITGVSGGLTHTTTVNIVVNPAPDFTLSSSPASQTVIQGNATSYNVTVSPTNGFAGQVTLSASGLPAGANYTFSPNPATGTSTLSVTTASTTPAGSYTLTITGVSGSLTHTATITLVIVAPDFSLTASPASQTVAQGRSTSYTITITPANGFGGPVTLSVSGLPTGATGTFSTNPATSSSTLTVAAAASSPLGTYTLTINGVSGALSHNATATLVVSHAGVTFDNKMSSGFDFGVTSLTTLPFVVGTGANRAAMIMVVMTSNAATNIKASLGGVAGTLIPGTDSGTTASGRTMIFQVINPPSGSQTATVSWTGSTSGDIGVITVSGADQTTPTTGGTFSAANSSPNATTSVTVASNAGDLTASVAYSANTWKSPFTNQVLKWGLDSAAAGGDVGPGTGTATHTWTDQYAGQTHSVSGANFKAAP